MVILDGKALAGKIIAALKEEYARLPGKLSLAAVVVGSDAVVGKFIAQKKKVAEELGVDFRVYEYAPDISTNELRKRLAVLVHDADPDGIIIQLPLPPELNRQYILNSVPPEKDVDMLSARAMGDFAVGKSRILPPVVGAVKALLEEYHIDVGAKHVLVIGAGMLVGKPVALWLTNEKASFSVVGEHTPDISEFIKKADVIITGVGKPNLITGDMVKEGTVVIDAGTAESGDPAAEGGIGKLVGDVDFDSVSPKASYITPVPGGVGPLTVAMIYQNLLILAQSKR